MLHCLRPYYVESTSSHLNNEVKQCRASLVLGWETAQELLVLQTFPLLTHSFVFRIFVYYFFKCTNKLKYVCVRVCVCVCVYDSYLYVNT